MTPINTVTPIFVATPTLAATNTPDIGNLVEYEIAGCPNSFIPDRVKAREGMVPGFEAGYLPADGFYPDTITMPMYALMMQDSLSGRDTFFGLPYSSESTVIVGTWELPEDTDVDVCNAITGLCVENVPVKEIGPTQRIIDIDSMQREANISLSRPVWNAIFGEHADDGPYPVTLTNINCGPGG